MILGFRGNSACLVVVFLGRRRLMVGMGSIVEGTKESLERLGLDNDDVLFAHRPDHTGECVCGRFGVRLVIDVVI